MNPPSVGTVDSLAPIWKGVGNTAAILGIISFILGKIPANKDNTQSMMRVCVGLNSNELTDAGGNCPDIRLFNEVHDFIGKAMDPGYVSEGSFIDVIIDQGDVRQPTSALVTANGAGNGKDGVCLAYLQSTWPDNQTFAWVGNWGRHCGERWYHSNVVLDGENLECLWLDSNGDSNTATALQVHFPSFNSNNAGYSENPDDYCDNLNAMHFFKEPNPTALLFYVKNRRSVRRQRSEPATAMNSTRLIKSRMTTHGTSELCESESSYGPDFVSYEEGQFCDMTTKTVWPLCKSEQDKDCFDIDAHDIRQIKWLGKRAVPVLAGFKSYSKVTEWEREMY